MDEQLKPCDNPECERFTAIGIRYCCGACGQAHIDHYEIHDSGTLAHSDGCNERFAKRLAKSKPTPQPPKAEGKA